jgi:addiction module HigA family antidote
MTSKSRTTTRAEQLPPVTPGEVLLEEFLKPLNISQNALAMALRVPATRIGNIINDGRGITADTALRLSRYFGTTPEFWMNLQAQYELNKARRTSLAQIELDVHRRERSEGYSSRSGITSSK